MQSIATRENCLEKIKELLVDFQNTDKAKIMRLF